MKGFQAHTCRISHRPCRSSLAAALTIAAAAVFSTHGAEAQQQIQLPIGAPLTTPRIELDLSDARVLVVVGSQQPPRIDARVETADLAPEVVLEAALEPGRVTRVRRPDVEDTPPKIIVEITLSADQRLTVVGSRIDLDISGAQTSAADNPLEIDPHISRPDRASSKPEDQAPDPAVDPVVAAIVTDSQVTARNLDGLSLTATTGIIDISNLHGPLVLDLRESEVHIRGHRGLVTIDAFDSDTTLENAEGRVSVNLDGGSLNVNQSRSTIDGKIVTADVAFDSVSGSVQLSGEESSIRITGAAKAPTQIVGHDLRVTLSDLGGSVRANLTRGTLDAELIAGRIDLQLSDEAQADLRDIGGDLAAVLTDGARAEVGGVTGHTRIRLRDGELNLRNLKSLELDAQRGLITGSGIRALTRLEATDSSVELFLDTVQGRPKINLRGTSDATIQLPTPCRVAAKMPEASFGDRIRVSGCHFDFDGHSKRSPRPGVDGRAPVVLTATLDETATLRVDGRP